MKIKITFISLLTSFLCLAQSKEIDTKPELKTETIEKNYDIKNEIYEEKYVLINGIEQWVTIKGNPSKPIILFIHGGPGSTISPYIDVLYKDLEKDFIIVQWDQRGAGRTYGRNSPPEELTPEYLKSNPLTLEQMTSDGVCVSEYLLKHLGKQKIILAGTSWGSSLGVKIVSKRPDLFYAYVGHSQIVSPGINLELYTKIYKMAEDRNDKESLEILNTIGKPPYSRAKSCGLLFKVLKKYERANSTPAPNNWFQLSPDYDNEIDEKNREDGDDYSFVNYVGDDKLGVQSMISTINLMRDNLDFKIPVYLIQGNEDIMTPKENSKKYFDKIKAPKKEYFLLPKAAHGFNQSVVETQYKIFKSIKTL
ncbi:MAG: alpha/beta hydrolase [Flavobacterium sp.]|uniref:alpha/beta hydrolase family protein n=1 Tax=Flavobacterium sp. TaxID=239 RepID=UPI0032657EE0